MALKSIYQFGPEDRSKEGQAQGAIIFDRIQIPALKALYELGEEEFHSNEELSIFIRERANIEDIDKQKHGVGDEFDYRLKWSLNGLKNSGLIVKDLTKYLSWKISKEGVEYLNRNELLTSDSIESDKLIAARKEISTLRLSLRTKINNAKRYWALGFGSDIHYENLHNAKNKVNRLDDFINKNYWQALDYDNQDDSRTAEKALKLFMEIEEGDHCLIKGYGGKSDLVVHYIGEVVKIDPEKNRIDFKKINNKLYHGKSPKGHGAGNWFNTILEVTRKPDIDLLFYGIEPIKEEEMGGADFDENEPLNKIIYGPPGTGKTYKLQTEYFEKFTTREAAITKDQYFVNIIGNYTWWQVIAAVLLDLKKAKVTEILDHDLLKYRINISNSTNVRAIIWAQLQGRTVDECKFVNVTERAEPRLFNKLEDSSWELVDELDNLSPQSIELHNQYKNFVTSEGEILKRYAFVTFHQSFGYEEFVEGIKPLMSKNDIITGKLNYEIKQGEFLKLCERARKDPKNSYAIFIDEINRGNVSAIFGELITLIESNKREGEKYAFPVNLAYSNEPFIVPKNVYIIGTMNTADRSVEALDTALRRRFTFEELLPNPEVIKSNGKSAGIIEVDGKEDIDLVELLITINKRLEVLIDRDHTIGHSFFMDVQTLTDLKDVFKDNIVPQLQEYFYGDYGKIGLVLGQGFVTKSTKDNKLFAKFDYDGKEDLNHQMFKLVDFKGMDFYNAIQNLLGKAKVEQGE